MKKGLFYLLFLFILSPKQNFAQIEKVIVETYYVSDSLDATDTIGGLLEAGSVTYRVYIDMAPGVKLRKIYGDQNHPLKFSSTEPFFNNRADGLSFAKDFNKTRLQENTVALDSWLTLGQTTRVAAKTYFGVLKSQDVSGSFIGGLNNDGGSAGVADGLLSNSDPLAGIPLTLADGMDTMNTLPTSWADYGFANDTTGVDSTIFSSAKRGTDFMSYHAALQNSGVMGVNPDSNQVLVAQLTTKGQISFDLNVEVEVPASPDPIIVKYVSSFAPGEMNSDTLKLSPFLKYPASCGCTDPNYLEYNAAFTCANNDSCRNRIVFGCMDMNACNYDPNANFNIQGMCCYPGNCADRDIAAVCPSLNEGRLTETELSIYPDPASDQISVKFTIPIEQTTRCMVYNVVGETVFSKDYGFVSGTVSDEINISGFPAGVYFFNLISGGDVKTMKIVKR